ncbi:mucin-4-like isoform X5 [Acanthaster planci]|uniref:Mucin-4-like isoform X5 n=1 Tax=Acanthaster planci TaxID=133434 RepID=A0A8B7Z0J4_ACAPL|nr:mucin-4-like isoform X5 [Acanthaster planci]
MGTHRVLFAFAVALSLLCSPIPRLVNGQTTDATTTSSQDPTTTSSTDASTTSSQDPTTTSSQDPTTTSSTDASPTSSTDASTTSSTDASTTSSTDATTTSSQDPTTTSSTDATTTSSLDPTTTSTQDPTTTSSTNGSPTSSTDASTTSSTDASTTSSTDATTTSSQDPTTTSSQDPTTTSSTDASTTSSLDPTTTSSTNASTTSSTDASTTSTQDPNTTSSTDASTTSSTDAYTTSSTDASTTSSTDATTTSSQDPTTISSQDLTTTSSLDPTTTSTQDTTTTSSTDAITTLTQDPMTTSSTDASTTSSTDASTTSSTDASTTSSTDASTASSTDASTTSSTDATTTSNQDPTTTSSQDQTTTSSTDATTTPSQDPTTTSSTDASTTSSTDASPTSSTDASTTSSTDATTTSTPDATTTSGLDVTTTSGTDITTTSSPDATTTSSPDTTTTSSPDATTTSGPDTTTSSPDATTTSSPDVATTSGTDATTTSGPDATTASSPDATTTLGPDTTTSSPEATTTSGPDVTTTSGTDATTTSGPDATTTSSPDTTTTSDPDATTTSGPDVTTASGQDATTTSSPDATTTSVPDATTASSPDTTTTSSPDATTTSGPDATTTSGPDATTTSGPDATTTSGPDVTTTSSPDATTTSGPDATTTSSPNTTTASSPDATTTSGPDTTTSSPDATTTSSPDATTTSGPDATTTFSPDTTTASRPDATTTSGPDTTTSSPDVTTTSGPDATTTSSPDTTTTLSPDATTTSGPVATTTSEPNATTTSGPDATTTSSPDTTTTSGPYTTTSSSDATTTLGLDFTTTPEPPATTSSVPPDTVGPAVTCPAMSFEDCTAGNDAVVDWLTQPSAVDDVDGPISAITCRDQDNNAVTSGGVYPIGVTTVTCTAQDSSENSGMCTFTITISASPSLSVPAVGDQNTDEGLPTATITWPAVTAINSDSRPIICTDSPSGAAVRLTGGAFGVGSHTVTCQVTNAADCPASSSFNFTVLDAEGPTVTCPAVSIEDCTAGNSAVVDWLIQPSAVDAVEGPINTITCRDQDNTAVMSGGMYPVGTTTVTCTAQDSLANSGMCTFTITISASPSLTIPTVSNQNTDKGLPTATVTWPAVTATNSDNQPIICTDSLTSAAVRLSGGTFGVGIHVVTCEVTNACDCPASASFIFTVIDAEGPTVTCPAVGIEDCTTGNNAMVDWLIQPSAVDAVDGPINTIMCRDQDNTLVTSGGMYPVGTTIITCTAQDSASNDGMCSFVITVYMSNLLPFGVAVGDSLLSDFADQPNFIPAEDLVSPTFRPLYFFPYCDDLYEFLYFTDNGVIILSNFRRLRYTANAKYAYPNPSRSFSGGTNIIAAFWEDVDASRFDSSHNVFYQVYDESSNGAFLATVSNIVSAQYGSFSARWALAITWSNVHTVFEDDFFATSTFQAIVLTDAAHSYVILNYDPCGMNWNPELSPAENIIMGYSCGSVGRRVFVDLPPGASTYRPGNVVGNAGVGRWIYQIDALGSDFVNPRLSCFDWYNRQTDNLLTYFSARRRRNTCPPNIIFALFFDWRWWLVRDSYLLPRRFPANSFLCFAHRFQRIGFPGPLCCYSTRWWGLVSGVWSGRVASVMERYPPLRINSPVYDQLRFQEDVLPRYYCCEQSTLCSLYVAKRPRQNWSRYRPPWRTWFFGDPHLRTLDGMEYTFNGLGEYTVALFENDAGQRYFELQGRTQRAFNSQTQQLSLATFFAAFAAEADGDARIEVKVNSEGTDLETKVNGNTVSPTAEGLEFGNFTVQRMEDPIQIIAIYPEDIRFTVSIRNGFADISLQPGQDYMGRSKGLLGLWDGDQMNDLQRRNGNLQEATGPNGNYSDQDVFNFAETWRTTESDSLFYYVSPDESWAELNDLTFIPKFLDDLINEADTVSLQTARDTCGQNKVCLYDTLATGNEAVGMASMEINDQNTADFMTATNSPPNFTLIIEEIEVVVGQPFTLQLEAVDPDGDQISFELLEIIPGASLTSPGGLFTWTPVDRSAVSLGFLASDGSANATLELVVKLCGCMNNATCLYDQFVSGTNVMADRFGVVLCNCTPGWSGEFCEVNFDACGDNPCYPGVACFDDDPPSLNFTCGSCPAGLEGDGRICIDIDECVLYRDEPASSNGRGCDQNCFNSLASFNCSCNSGYLLFVDGKRCIDIDECDLRIDNCADDAMCNNTVGSFECICNEGFMDVTGDGTFCQDINECTGVNGCDSNATCGNTIGSYRCTCNEGYEGSGFTCADIDECSRSLDDCHTQANCTNTNGSYNCTCNDGWAGNGRTCTNENECQRSQPVCNVNATCTDTIGSFSCQCNVGFTGDGLDCQDIDECALDIDGCRQECVNNIGSFKCTCNEAFTQQPDGSCVAQNNCSASAMCINGDCYLNGSNVETCLCYSGYEIATDPMVCEDIDECATGTDNCAAMVQCNNTVGGYDCLCRAGFELNNDQRSCSDIDECTLPINDPLFAGCDQNALCFNRPGSFLCTCDSGYEGNGTVCSNIDECSSAMSPCLANATCTDTDGSYLCVCDDGFRGDGRVLCVNINECEENPNICHSLAMCTDSLGSYQCDCNQGYQGNGTFCEDINECTSNSHECAAGRADCLNNDGSFTCTCMDGYVSTPGMISGRQCDDIDECALELDTCTVSVSVCNNINGSYTCECLTGYEKNMNQCVDVNECNQGTPCASQDNSECVNLPASFDCQCIMGYYLENTTCQAGVSYNASAIFEIVSGLLVGSPSFDLETGYVTYRSDLKQSIETAFRGSTLSSNFGDVTVSDISLASELSVLVRFVINLQSAQPEETIIMAFLSQLTGATGGQLAPDHRLIRSTFIIGDPNCNAAPCANGGTCAEDNSLPAGYVCSCLLGFSGQNCEIGPCGNSPCMNGATCSVNSTTSTGYLCLCARGYTGLQCQTTVPCDLGNECTNGATCVNMPNSIRGYTCACPDGFSGENCETACQLNNCMNGGTRDNATCQCVCSQPWTGSTCLECSLTCTNGGTLNSVTCECSCPGDNWTGRDCSECPLTESSCMNGGLFDAEHCECVCPLTHNGTTCENDNLCLSVDKCSDSTTGRYCVPTSTGFTCECRIFDGFFMVSSVCQQLSSITAEFRAVAETFRAVYNNPTSSAFKEKIVIFERLVLIRLMGDASTRSVLSAHVIRLQSGSVVVSMVLQYPSVSPQLNADVLRVLSSSNELTDGAVTIPIDPSSVTVNDTTTDCPADYCQNGGTCSRLGYYPSQITYSCSCGASFTGQDCGTAIPGPTSDVTTMETTTQAPDGGVSTLAIILIVVGCVFLLLAAVGLLVCLCFLMRRRYEAGLHSYPDWRKPRDPRVNYGLSEYPDYNSRFEDNRFEDNWYSTSSLRDEDIRMNRLRNVMSHSPYLRQYLPRRDEFVRPYVASGMEELYRENERHEDGAAGRVVYNPSIYN